MVASLERSAKKQDRYTVVFFISDGEITNDDKLKSFSGASSYLDGGAVLGYGTSQGGQMKVQKSMYMDEKGYLEDTESSSNAVSKINENNLKTIAQDMGIDYIHMEKHSIIEQSSMTKIIRFIQSLMVCIRKRCIYGMK